MEPTNETDEKTDVLAVVPGFEVIPLDLSKVPEAEQAIVEAEERERLFVELVKEAFFPIEGAALFREHMPLSSFINRAISLHRGVLSAVRETNPHAAYTLLRAQYELLALVRYLDLHPDYLTDLERPKPLGKRRTFRELFADAAKEMRGIRHVYATLSEMAHFGSTALWHPFTITDEENRMMSFGTAPHWRHDDEERVVLGMLAEADEGLLVMLGRYSDHHVMPQVLRFRAKKRVGRAIASLGPEFDEDGLSSISTGLATELYEAGFVHWCEEHQAVEQVDDLDPERVEAWVEQRGRTTTQ